MEEREERPQHTERRKFTPGGHSKFIKKKCRFCKQKVNVVDYKDVNLLRRFLTPAAKILSSRVSGNCLKHQAMVSNSIKKARFLALIPYIVR